MQKLGKCLIILGYLAPTLLSAQRLNTVSELPPLLKSEPLPLVEIPPSGNTSHEYTLTLPDRLRDFHFVFDQDLSACPQLPTVNGQPLPTADATDVFDFSRANRIRLTGCLERTPTPLTLTAHPRVYLARSRAVWAPRSPSIALSLTLRNTLANSVSLSVTITYGEQSISRDLFLGPETSQTIELSLPSPTKPALPLSVELWKHAEAIQPAYRQIHPIPIQFQD